MSEAEPVVRANDEQLSATVRAAHSPDIAGRERPPRAGDLLFMSHETLADQSDRRSNYVARLHALGVVAIVVVSTGDTDTASQASYWDRLAQELPVIMIQTDRPLATYLMAIAEKLLERQTAALVSSQRVHDVFTALGAAGSGPEEILAAAHRLVGAAVGFETSDHSLLDFVGAAGADLDFAADWEFRSRSVPPKTRSFWDQRVGWLVCPIGASTARKGRVVFSSPTAPGPTEIATAERTAAALDVALDRLAGLSIHSRQHHKQVIEDLSRNPSNPDVCRRAWLAGMSTENRKYVGLVVRPFAADGHSYGDGSVQHKLEAACLRAAKNTPMECLAAGFERDVRVILAMPIGADEVRLTDDFAAVVREGAEVAFAAGTSVSTLKSVDLSLREAMDVMSAVRPDSAMDAVFRLTNMRIRGLLTLLSGDSRLTDFAERELGLLRQESALCRIDLIHTVLVLIENWHSKSLAAKRLHVSRPVLYDRIRKIEALLGSSLDSGELRTSLHVAILSKSLASAPGVDAWQAHE